MFDWKRSSRWPTGSCSASPRTTSWACATDGSRNAPSSPSCSVWAIRLRLPAQLLQCLDRLRETALVPGAGVGVQDAFRHHAVDRALRLLHLLLGGALV